MKIIIKSCAKCPFMYNDDHDGELKCNLQCEINEESNNIIIESEPIQKWCPLITEDYHFSINDNESIYDNEIDEFNNSIQHINSQLDTLKNASVELNELVNKLI